jgi:signal transduction histidine kinase
VRFVAGSLIALVAIGIVTLFVAKNLAEGAALREARTRGAALARVVAGPLVNADLRRGDKGHLSVLGDAMRSRQAEGGIVHIKLWDSDGQVLWSDEHTLRGRHYRLEPAVRQIFGTSNVVSHISRLDRDENELESDKGPLLEVYAGAIDADGVPLVFETYWSDAMIAEDRHAIMDRLAPVTLGSLTLFAVAVFPLAMSLGRRVDRTQSERNTMLRHAISAADLERRRIAQDLHDGVVQDLAGLAFALPSIRDQLPASPAADPARRVIDELKSVVQRDIAGLRSMLTETYPPGLEDEGLVAAVDALAKRGISAGVTVTVDVGALADERLDDIRLVYRVIREGLRNVVRHAHAANATVSGTRAGADLVVVVADDGRGPGGAAIESGHLGLRVLADLLRDVGGTLELLPRTGGGTILRAAFPAATAVL